MYIEQFSVSERWMGNHSLAWVNIYADVNILVGINGAGKTTLLNYMYQYYTNWSSSTLKGRIAGTDISVPVTFITSFDVPSSSKKKDSPLLTNLNALIYQNKEQTSFFDYRMRALDFPEQKDRVLNRIEHFYEIVKDYFKETKKTIVYDREKNRLAFKMYDGQQIEIDNLSAGEKQLLLILLTVFLMDERPNVLLMDEPELSLHLSWQEKLVSTIRHMNPNCQLILTTHSPSIFVNGWQDRLVFIEDLIKG